MDQKTKLKKIEDELLRIKRERCAEEMAKGLINFIYCNGRKEKECEKAIKNLNHINNILNNEIYGKN